MSDLDKLVRSEAARCVTLGPILLLAPTVLCAVLTLISVIICFWSIHSFISQQAKVALGLVSASLIVLAVWQPESENMISRLSCSLFLVGTALVVYLYKPLRAKYQSLLCLCYVLAVLGLVSI